MAPIRKVLAVCMALLAGMTAFGQSPEGAIVGTVVDSSGAAVAGARVSVVASQIAQRRSVSASRLGEFKLESLPPGTYQVRVEARSFASVQMDVAVAVSSRPTLRIVLKPAATQQSLTVQGTAASMAAQPLETTSSVVKTTVSAADLREIPLAHRSFANIAYLAPMTEPVEPSDPTKARITAVSFGGSSGLNVDLSVDGGDNNDDFIGGFLQNYSPDAMQEFTVRTAQFDADTSRTNGGSVIITTRHGTNDWHGDVSGYYRNRSLNARNPLDNPVPEPKQPFARGNGTASVGGPLVKDRIWFFSSFEYVHEDSSVGYSGLSLSEFNALSQLAAGGRIPGVQSIAVPSSVGTPFRDSLASTRLDFAQSERSHWFVRGAFDLNRAENDLVHQGALPSTGFTTTSHYFSLLVNHQLEMTPEWIGSLTLQASGFHHEKVRNSNVGFALAFPFSASFHTTSGFETFGDNQFVTPITAFPVNRDQQKYQFRYDLAHAKAEHSYKIGVNLIHEPVLSGRLSDNGEILHVLPENPSFYVVNPGNFATDFNNPANQVEACASTSPPGQCLAPNDGRFAQSVRRLGLYLQDSWRLRSNLALNYGLRYDTTFGLFNSNGGNQNQNSAVLTVASQNLALPTGVPHDYRKAIAPRLGLAWSPRGSGTTV
ncbi:MAG TPA: TonB-dependent receptor, partial [Alphaproteobacteria bacterium]|nr:TonB-dependent receptor [Alphaproteobacteria bacterium]